jgi:hypothetical protein
MTIAAAIPSHPLSSARRSARSLNAGGLFEGGMREGLSIAEAVAVARQSAPRCSRCRSGSKELPTECIFYFGGPE